MNKWILLALLLLCGCDNPKLNEIEADTGMVEAEIRQCHLAIKAIDNEKAKLAEQLAKEKALQAEIAALKAKKKHHP